MRTTFDEIRWRTPLPLGASRITELVDEHFTGYEDADSLELRRFFDMTPAKLAHHFRRYTERVLRRQVTDETHAPIVRTFLSDLLDEVQWDLLAQHYGTIARELWFAYHREHGGTHEAWRKAFDTLTFLEYGDAMDGMAREGARA